MEASCYFDPEHSIGEYTGSIDETLGIIAARYIAHNPPLPFRFHAFRTDAFLARPDGRFDLNLLEKLPNAANGKAALACARIWSESESENTLSISCYGPVRLYINGCEQWRSGVSQEVNAAIKEHITISCKKGWNTLLVFCRKTASGFGCILGAANPRWQWVCFAAPFPERRGQVGFVHTTEMNPEEIDIKRIDAAASEPKNGYHWLPEQNWDASEYSCGCFGRIFGLEEVKYACAWAQLYQYRPGRSSVTLSFKAGSRTELYLDCNRILPESGSASIKLDAGSHDVFVSSECNGGSCWDFELKAAYEDGTELSLAPPCAISGMQTSWLYLGMREEKPTPEAYQTMYRLFGNKDKVYWRADEPSSVIRPYLENACFGRWNYPLGVTLYGLIQTGRVLNRPDIELYVNRHIDECVSLYQYSLWDAEQYGYPEINQQLYGMHMLDDCGSFGSVMLEAAGGRPDVAVRTVADRIADHMENHQERRPDGAFYRKLPGSFMEDTLWVDDLYMSVPFLCRYYRLTGESKYLEDAASQILRFRDYLFMPEYKVMSHVYDFKYNTPTYMPWGRGNGWCLFALSQLLEVMPEGHESWEELLGFFTELCDGYIALQGENGLWHQLLTHPDSYEETSCTSMFIYAFCRAVRFGWARRDQAARLTDAARRGWMGLCRTSIDNLGNIYGVCGGSAYSFAPEYYKDVLSWVINDTHGTGVVLLAGIEMAMTLKNLSNH